jgi:hypothetical protein
MTDRRYSDDEVAEIFARASETEQQTRHQLPAPDGLTLGELQRIGQEAGIGPELVAQAARSLDQPRQPDTPLFLGLPVGAARTVRLERRMSDAEWERLVVDLRETFNARGVVRTEGSLRHWSNGNLQVMLEPDGEGQRVRFRTIKGTARPYMFTGLGLMGAALAIFLAALPSGNVVAGEAFGSVGFMGLIGAGFFAAGAFPLKRWARLRREQMDRLADRLLSSARATLSEPSRD